MAVEPPPLAPLSSTGLHLWIPQIIHLHVRTVKVSCLPNGDIDCQFSERPKDIFQGCKEVASRAKLTLQTLL